MPAPSGISSGVGFRNAKIFQLDASGYPAATATTAYNGTLVSGARALTINMVEPRRINYLGDDGVIDIDQLPALEADSGELRTGKLNFVLDAILTGQKQFTVGEASLFLSATEKRGFEAQVALMGYRQAKETDPTSSYYGQRVWQFVIMPKVQLIPRYSGWTENPEENMYSLIPAKVSKHLWGTSFGEATEGALLAQMVWGKSFNKPQLVAFKGDGVEDEFLFPATAQAVSTAKITVWKNGTIQTVGITKAVTGVTFTAAPASGDMVVVFYETA